MFPFPFGFIGSGEVIPDLELISNDYAMEFDGTSWVETTSNFTQLGISTAFSISCWFRISTNTNYDHVIGGPTSWNAWDSGFGLYCNGSGVRFWVDTWNVPANQHVSSGALNNDQWYHAVCTFDTTSGLKLYIDAGTAITAAGTNFTGLSNNIFIGSTGTNAGYGFNGDIDEVAIWNKVLSADDVTTIYNSTNNNPGKCANLFTGGLGSGLVYWNRMGD